MIFYRGKPYFLTVIKNITTGPGSMIVLKDLMYSDSNKHSLLLILIEEKLIKIKKLLLSSNATI